LAAFGGLAGLLFGQKSEKVSAAGAANQIAYYTAPDTLAGSENLKWYDSSRNFVAGWNQNVVASGAVGATISGGGFVGNTNRITDDYGTIGGGYNNQVGNGDGYPFNAAYATVGGGNSNMARGMYATVGGGNYNQATGTTATVGGGDHNTAAGIVNATVGGGCANSAAGDNATISGGNNNLANGSYSAVPGGGWNVAAGDYSFAAGRRAKINAAHDGTFLYADQSDYDFNSSAVNEFAVRATGGARFVTEIDGSGNPTKTIVMTPAGDLGVGTATPTACVHGETSSTSGTGVYGYATAGTGTTYGVYGKSESTSGTGVYGTGENGVNGTSGSTSGTGIYGKAYAGTGNTYGVYGESASTDGKGVYGYTPASTGNTYGIFGGSNSASGTGVCGQGAIGVMGQSGDAASKALVARGFSSQAANLQEWQNDTGTALSVVDKDGKLGVGTTTPFASVHAIAASTSGVGVQGYASAATGAAIGVYGSSASTSGRGLYGYVNATTGPTLGVYGRSDSTSGTGTQGHATATSGTTTGVYGRSDSTSGRGVFGSVTATSGGTLGAYGQVSSTSGIGVYGYAGAATGTTRGIYGRSVSPDGKAVEGFASGGGIGGRFRSDTGPAVEAQGDMLPSSDNAYNCGKDGRRWKLLRAVTVTPGDLVFENGARVTEEAEGFAFVNPQGRKIAVLDSEGNLRIKGRIIQDL